MSICIKSYSLCTSFGLLASDFGLTNSSLNWHFMTMSQNEHLHQNRFLFASLWICLLLILVWPTPLQIGTSWQCHKMNIRMKIWLWFDFLIWLSHLRIGTSWQCHEMNFELFFLFLQNLWFPMATLLNKFWEAWLWNLLTLIFLKKSLSKKICWRRSLKKAWQLQFCCFFVSRYWRACCVPCQQQAYPNSQSHWLQRCHKCRFQQIFWNQLCWLSFGRFDESCWNFWF